MRVHAEGWDPLRIDPIELLILRNFKDPQFDARHLAEASDISIQYLYEVVYFSQPLQPVDDDQLFSEGAGPSDLEDLQYSRPGNQDTRGCRRAGWDEIRPVGRPGPNRPQCFQRHIYLSPAGRKVHSIQEDADVEILGLTLHPEKPDSIGFVCAFGSEVQQKSTCPWRN